MTYAHVDIGGRDDSPRAVRTNKIVSALVVMGVGTAAADNKPVAAMGLAPGVHVLTVAGIPVEAWKGKKFVALLGVTVP